MQLTTLRVAADRHRRWTDQVYAVSDPETESQTWEQRRACTIVGALAGVLLGLIVGADPGEILRWGVMLGSAVGFVGAVLLQTLARLSTTEAEPGQANIRYGAFFVLGGIGFCYLAYLGKLGGRRERPQMLPWQQYAFSLCWVFMGVRLWLLGRKTRAEHRRREK